MFLVVHKPCNFDCSLGIWNITIWKSGSCLILRRSVFVFLFYFSRQLIWLSSAFRYWPYFLGMWSNVKSGVSEPLKCYLDLSSYASLYDMSFSSLQFSCSVISDSLPPHGTPGLPVHHQLPEFTQTHIHWVCHIACLLGNVKSFAIFWSVISLIIELRGLFIYSGCKYPYQIQNLKIFFPVLWVVFSHPMSFESKLFLTLMKSNLSIFFIDSLGFFGTVPKNLLPSPRSQISTSVFEFYSINFYEI